MAIVVDASLLVRLASGGEWPPEIDAKIASWLTSGEELHSSDLLFYEVESGLRKMVFDGNSARRRRSLASRTSLRSHRLAGPQLGGIPSAAELGAPRGRRQRGRAAGRAWRILEHSPCQADVLGVAGPRARPSTGSTRLTARAVAHPPGATSPIS